MYPIFRSVSDHNANSLSYRSMSFVKDVINSLASLLSPSHTSQQHQNPSFNAFPYFFDFKLFIPIVSSFIPILLLCLNFQLVSKFAKLRMSFVKELINSFSRTNMEGVAGSPVTNQRRAANRLKNCFDFSMEQFDKAVMAEKSGLVVVACRHYSNAQRILREGCEWSSTTTTNVPSCISSSEQEKIKFYSQNISRWNGEISHRLRLLTGLPGLSSLRTSSNKITLTHAHTAAVPSTKSELKSDLSQKSPSFVENGQVNRNLTDKAASSNPIQDCDNGYEAELAEKINNSIVDKSPSVKWDDVAGLEEAKQSLMEMVVLPIKRKDLFTGLRKPAKGLLLFGPPGNGKTMLAKAVASESEATFFNVSASDLTSKWVGEAEKLVRTLFTVAIARQPSVIFMDEIDSIMSTRLANESESSRRLKSEFLTQFDGVTSNPSDLVMVIGATNKPQELDDAVLRRLVKRIYVPLPDKNVRKLLLKNELKGRYFLPDGEIDRLVRETEGYSGSDLKALCEEAAKMPLRELGPKKVLTVDANRVRPLSYEDFRKTMPVIRPVLSRGKLGELERWNQNFGSNWTSTVYSSSSNVRIGKCLVGMGLLVMILLSYVYIGRMPLLFFGEKIIFTYL